MLLLDLVFLLIFLCNLIFLLLRFPGNLIIDIEDKSIDSLYSVVYEIVDIVCKDEGCGDIHEEVLAH